MKLLTQTNRIYFGFSLVIYLLTAIAFYQIVRLLIYDDVESRLRVERRDFEAYIRTHQVWSGSPSFVENKIDVARANPIMTASEVFTDTLIQNRYDVELVPFRQLTFYAPIKGVLYQVSIRKSLIQSYRLIEGISLTMAVFLGLLLGGTFWFQGKLSERVWRPFYATLARMKEFDLSRNDSLYLKSSGISEFSELNQVLQKMADKMQQDYRNLKEFTENASHEMQTPLALINAKVEQLIQSEQLTTTQTQWIDSIYQASRRISRLNQGLLLLAKIENRQFADVQAIDLTAELTRRLADMDEVLVHKQISATVLPGEAFWAQLPPQIADSLLTNLLSNAIRHNQPGGRIEVHSSDDQLQLKNTGPVLVMEPEALFERFKKGISNNESIGLGLAIVKQICDTYQLEIAYHHEKGIHALILTAGNAKIGSEPS